MPCFAPVPAIQDESGAVRFVERRGGGGPARSLLLPCGQCLGCRLERSRQWAMRCVHEASLHSSNCFLTLTYDNDHLPPAGTLRYSDFQKFMKRLRKRVSPREVRFYAAGEYGSSWRGHYHVCLFGFGFPDKYVHSVSGAGSDLYRSPLLESLWPFGFSSIGELNFESAAYAARYIIDKVNGDLADAHYLRVDKRTGELVQCEPEFNRMSLKPGIGARWFEKFQSDVFPADHVVIGHRPSKPPRAYDRYFKRLDPLGFAEVQSQREFRSYGSRAENFPERLQSRYEVAKARLSFSKRSLK